MKDETILSFARRALSDQRGQTLPFVALAMVALLGVGGLVVDVGHAYVVRSQLQNSANAAALAASGAVYNAQSDAINSTSIANQYGSAAKADNNYFSGLGAVTTAVSTKCLNSLMPPGETCGAGSPSNAVQVTNSTAVKTFLMSMLGIPALNVSATATASIQGTANSWNVAIIVDGTSSMSTSDSNCGGLTEFQCALSSVQVFLEHVNPGTGNVRVSLFSFPNLSTTGFSNTATCSSTFTNEPYTLPSTTATTYAPIKYTGTTAFTATYQLAAFDSGYWDPTNSSTAGLNSSDNLVKTIGAAYNTTNGSKDITGCLPNKGGESTYFAAAIYAAQAALIQEQAANPGSKNALILLSDGEANADSSKFPAKTSTAATGGVSVTSAGSSTWSSTATNLTGVSGTWGKYPDFNDECQQGIVAAQAATAAGTTVYAVAYGSESTGCGAGGGTDTHLYATGNNIPFTLSSLTACVTMENIASSMSYFYSDPNQTGSGSSCTDTTHTTATLADISLAIAANFTTPRLLPNNAQ
jgi:Flp pilus assembly protein TadG